MRSIEIIRKTENLHKNMPTLCEYAKLLNIDTVTF